MKDKKAGTDYLDIRTAADRLGVNPETLRRWDRDGYVTAYRTPGNVRRFKVADIDKLLTERKSA